MEARDRVRSVTANEVLKSQDVSCGSFRFVAVARQGRITVEMATLSLNSDVRRFLDTFVSTNRAPEKPGSEARGARWRVKMSENYLAGFCESLHCFRWRLGWLAWRGGVKRHEE